MSLRLTRCEVCLLAVSLVASAVVVAYARAHRGERLAERRLRALGATLELRSGRVDVVNLSRLPIRDDALDLVTALPSTRSLVLNGAPITDAAIERIAGHPGIESMNLYSTGVRWRGIRRLAEVPRLWELRLGPLLDDAELVHTSRLEGIESLHLRFDAGVRIDGRPIEYDIDDRSVVALGRMPGLRSLTVELGGAEIGGWDALRATRPDLTLELAP